MAGKKIHPPMARTRERLAGNPPFSAGLLPSFCRFLPDLCRLISRNTAAATRFVHQQQQDAFTQKLKGVVIFTGCNTNRSPTTATTERCCNVLPPLLNRTGIEET